MNQPPQQQPTPPAPSWAVNAFFVACFLAGAAIIYTAVVEMVHSEALGEGAVTTSARVTDTRIMTSRKRGESYEVRFAFDVGGRTYTFRDATGREDLWESVTQEAWNSARSTNTIDVAYMPNDPWVNRAVEQARPDLTQNIIGLCTGLVCTAPALLAIVGALRKRRGPAPVA